MRFLRFTAWAIVTTIAISALAMCMFSGCAWIVGHLPLPYDNDGTKCETGGVRKHGLCPDEHWDSEGHAERNGTKNAPQPSPGRLGDPW